MLGYMADTKKILNNHEQRMADMDIFQADTNASLKNLETQVGQLTLSLQKKSKDTFPFAEALAQMPNYAKFIKDIISKKGKLDDYGTVNLSANYSVVIQRRMSQKMQDLGSFTIPCAIGNHEFGRAFCDSGASINLIPSSVARRLSLGSYLLPI